MFEISKELEKRQVKSVEQIKVIEYISNFGDGGAETLVKDYVRLIDHKRFEPIVVTLRGEKKSANRHTLEENHIPIIDIYPRWNMAVRIWNKVFGWWYIPHKLRKIIRSENAKVMHMHLMVLKDVARVGSALDGMRLFFTCHNVPESVFGGERIGERRAAEKLVRNNNLQLIALHREMAQEINRMFDIDNTVVIWNGIDVMRFQNINLTSEMERKKLSIPQNAFVVGHVGRFADQKNHDFLVDVFIEVAKVRPNAFLLMVGAGDSAHIEERLRTSGLEKRYMILSQRSDVNEIMRAMDVFVFPSKYEGLPLALIEAQYSGLRCIVSNKITKEAVCTQNVIMIPLENQSICKNAIIDTSKKGVVYTPRHLFDMNEVIREIERLYSGESR